MRRAFCSIFHAFERLLLWRFHALKEILVRVVSYLKSQSLVLNSYFGYTFQLLRFLGPTNASLIFYLLPYRWKSMGHIPKVIKSSRCKGCGWERSLSLSSISGVPQLVSPSVLVLIEIRFRYKARFRMASSRSPSQSADKAAFHLHEPCGKRTTWVGSPAVLMKSDCCAQLV